MHFLLHQLRTRIEESLVNWSNCIMYVYVQDLFRPNVNVTANNKRDSGDVSKDEPNYPELCCNTFFYILIII